jgi:anti-sigma-K factor RsiG
MIEPSGTGEVACPRPDPDPLAGPGPQPPARRLDRVLAADFTTGLGGLPLAELRERRVDALAEEGDLSYLRRVLHGRIDILAAESGRRTDGDSSPLVGRLTEILVDAPSARSASTRHLALSRTPPPAGEYRAALEARLRELAVPDLADCSDVTLRSAATALAGYEREVSDLRRKVQSVVDECAAELARRYREGEAAVDDLLVGD